MSCSKPTEGSHRRTAAALAQGAAPDGVGTDYRPARGEDAAEFIRIRALTRENAVSATRLRALGITVDSWAGDLRSGGVVGFVAWRGRRMLGYCCGDAASGEIVVLALLPEAEGQGIGRELLRLVVAALAQRGHARLFLGCSTDPDSRSYGFYRHLGWRSTGRRDRLGDEELELLL